MEDMENTMMMDNKSCMDWCGWLGQIWNGCEVNLMEITALNLILCPTLHKASLLVNLKADSNSCAHRTQDALLKSKT